MSAEAKQCAKHGAYFIEACPGCQYQQQYSEAAAYEARQRFEELRRQRLESFDHTPGLWVIAGRIAFGR